MYTPALETHEGMAAGYVVPGTLPPGYDAYHAFHPGGYAGYPGLGQWQALVPVATQAGGSLFAGAFAPPEWAAEAKAGTSPCPGPYDRAEVRAALDAAPEGQYVPTQGYKDTPLREGPHWQRGTRQGASLALRHWHRVLRDSPPADNHELANALVYVAHGSNPPCDPEHWKNAPAREHLDVLLDNYRNREESAPGLFGGPSFLTAGVGGAENGVPWGLLALGALAIGAGVLLETRPR